MEIRERIESCLSELEARRRMMLAYRERLKGILDAVRAEGGSPGSLGDALAMLETVLADYDEISESCGRMVAGLTEIGQYVDRIEDGRRKILSGVEAILKNLSHLDQMTAQDLPLGAGPETEEGRRPRRVLLIRIRQEGSSAAEGPPAEEDTNVDASLRRLKGGGTTVH